MPFPDALANYIDIHTHTYYEDADTTILLNVFAGDRENLIKPAFKSVGLHPWHIQDNNFEKQLISVESVLSEENVIAVGEAGLDKTIKTGYILQNEIFSRQLKMSELSRKPLIIHCVRSYSEMLAYRKKSDQSIPWIFHWFNADIQTARELIRKNCYLSFGHMLFNAQSRAYKVFSQIPAEYIFFETDDAGYSIQEVYKQAGLLRMVNPDDLKSRIMDNFTACFQI